VYLVLVSKPLAPCHSLSFFYQPSTLTTLPYPAVQLTFQARGVMLQTHLVRKLNVSVVDSTWPFMPAGQKSPAKGVAPIDLVLSVSAARDSGDRVDPFGTKVSVLL